VKAFSEKSDAPTGWRRKLMPMPFCGSKSALRMDDCWAALARDSTHAPESVSDPPKPSIC